VLPENQPLCFNISFWWSVENWLHEILTVCVCLVNCIVLEVVGGIWTLNERNSEQFRKKIYGHGQRKPLQQRNNWTIRQTNTKQSHTLRSYRCHTESEGVLHGWGKEQMGKSGTGGQPLPDSLTALLSAFARRHWKVTLNLSCLSVCLHEITLLSTVGFSRNAYFWENYRSLLSKLRLG
jgi:hypothetical protein